MKRIFFCSSLVGSLMLMSFFQKAKSGVEKISAEMYKVDDSKVKLSKEDEAAMRKSIMEAYGLKKLSGNVELKFIEGEEALRKGWNYRTIVAKRAAIGGGGEYLWRETKPADKMQKPIPYPPIDWKKYDK